MLSLLFLSSGLFLGWSLGANDAANVFGTAVASRMVRFRTAAVVSGIFIILGAGISGSGAAHTLGKLGSVNELAGSFMVALAAALTVYWMTRFRLPVSTSQSIVGAILGWNLFSGSLTDMNSLTSILMTWVLCPVLAAVFSMILYLLVRALLNSSHLHLLKMDFLNRAGLIIVGAFGAYSLGANNIANVMGVFTSVSPFRTLNAGTLAISGEQQLFIMGGIAIAVGVFTYSGRVMKTVGNSIVRLTPETALVVVLASALVMFLFASEGLENILASNGLPTIPLVPVSSSQAVVGAVLGIGLMRGRGRGINYRMLARIASGWVTTPVIAGVITFISLFFLQNVFNQNVYRPVSYSITDTVMSRLETDGIPAHMTEGVRGRSFSRATDLAGALRHDVPAITAADARLIVRRAEIRRLRVDTELVRGLENSEWLSDPQLGALRKLGGREYTHTWQFHDDLASLSGSWKFREKRPENRLRNRNLDEKLDYLDRVFSSDRSTGR